MVGYDPPFGFSFEEVKGMGKLSISKLTASAESALGWPYVRPGSNNSQGIDCSGLFVYMYRQQGASIAHGSNSIFHEYCSSTGVLTSESQLHEGMAVFKLLAWTDDDKDNRWYGHEPGNLSHIGYVASTNPLKIIHASSVAGKVTIDTSIKKWAYWGYLKDVDYGTTPVPDPSPAPSPEPSPSPTPEPDPMWAKVYSKNGKHVHMRKATSISSAVVDNVPCGAEVLVLKYDPSWCYIAYTDKRNATWYGYMMTDFLVIDQPVPSPDPSPAPSPGKLYTVTVYHLTWEDAEKLRMDYLDSDIAEERG